MVKVKKHRNLLTHKCELPATGLLQLTSDVFKNEHAFLLSFISLNAFWCTDPYGIVQF